MARVELQSLLDRSIKNMGNGMNPVVKESALEMIKRAYEEGINVQISAGYRSMHEQAALYGQGRSYYVFENKNYGDKSKPKVTQALPGQSFHNFGLAVDFFLVSEDGKTAIWTVNDKWRRVAEIGKSLGFKWGGDWASFKDNPHLEMTGGLTYYQLMAGRKPLLVSKVKGSNTVAAGEPANSTTDKTETSKPKGDTKTKVIQNTLNSRYKAGLVADGLYGPATKKALLKGLQTEINQQYKKKLTVDGKWGAKTKAAAPTVREGAKGDISYIIQAFLYLNGYDPKGIDGIFGPGTTSAVKKFQGAKKISKDGIAGPGTFEKMFK